MSAALKTYCIDANVLITPKNGPYGFDLMPDFWKWLHGQFSKGTVFSSKLVYDEVAMGKDDLANWVAENWPEEAIKEPSDEVQAAYQEIADYVEQKYADHQVKLFLSGADPWLIALAKVSGATVVTQEVLAPSNTQKVKIPNVCKHFGIKYVDLYSMMRDLGYSKKS